MTTRRLRILYISGWQRSGSTILANILGQLDGLVSTGELYYLWDFVWSRNIRCGCGSGFHECPLWTKVVATAFGSGDRIDVDRMRRIGELACSTRRLPRLMVPWSRRRLAAGLHEYVTNLGRLYSAILSATGGSLIVDSSKWPSYGRILQMVPGVEIKVVHLVRDPRAVAWSWLRRKALPDRDPPEEMYRTPTDSSLHWLAWNVAAESFWGREMLLLRYEDFVREPAVALRQILEFAGEGARRVAIAPDRTVDLRPTHTVSGNPLRLRSGPVRIEEDDEWKSRMRRRDLALVTALTFPMLLRYGYVGSAAAPRRSPSPIDSIHPRATDARVPAIELAGGADHLGTGGSGELS
jgi:hypothetical protein